MRARCFLPSCCLIKGIINTNPLLDSRRGESFNSEMLRGLNKLVLAGYYCLGTSSIHTSTSGNRKHKLAQGDVLNVAPGEARRSESVVASQDAVSAEKVGHPPTTHMHHWSSPACAVLRDAEHLGLSLEWRCSKVPILLQVISHLGRSLYATIDPFVAARLDSPT